MKALVIGASGLVGRALLQAGVLNGDRTFGTYLRHAAPGLIPLDLRDRRGVERLVTEFQPEVIYVPAATTQVDWCETHEDESRQVNVDGPVNVCAAALGRARIVYFSTDYVFDGTAGPYAEAELPHPLNVYGRHKAEAEARVVDASGGLVVRTTWVFDAEDPPRNFVARSLRELRAGREITAPDDQWGNPTYAPSLAAATVEAAHRALTGVLHLAGPSVINRYQLGVAVAEAAGLPAHLVRPQRTVELGQAARRPLRAGLLVDKARSLLDTPLTDYRTALEELLKRS